MNIVSMLDQIKKHPDYPKVGMVLCHNGVVRATTREGEAVTGLTLTVDHQRLAQILAKQRATSGIVEILVHIEEKKHLAVGDDVMFLVVAGDIRETVIKTLTDTLNQIKSEVTKKTQFFAE